MNKEQELEKTSEQALIKACKKVLPILGAACSNAATNSNETLRALRTKAYDQFVAAIVTAERLSPDSTNTNGGKRKP